MSDHARSTSRAAWRLGHVLVAGAACIAALAGLITAAGPAWGQGVLSPAADPIATTLDGKIHNSLFSVYLPKHRQWTEPISDAALVVLFADAMPGCLIRAGVLWTPLDPAEMEEQPRPGDDEANGGWLRRGIANVMRQQAVLDDGIRRRLKDHATGNGGLVIFSADPLPRHAESGALCKGYRVVTTDESDANGNGQKIFMQSIGVVCIHPDLVAAVLLEYTHIHFKGEHLFSDFQAEGLSFIDSVEFVRK